MIQPVTAESPADALTVLRGQFARALAAAKCHGCGCLLHTIEALEKAAPAIPDLGAVLEDTRRVLIPKKYDCLVLCGEDTRQLIGHLPGQSMESLFARGLDEKQRIVGAKGRRPFLKNVPRPHVELFRKQVRLVSMIGEQDVGRIVQSIADRAAHAVQAFGNTVTGLAVETVRATVPHKSDPAGS